MENMYKKARLQAAKKNPELKSVQRATELRDVNIPRERLLAIEQSDPKKHKEKPNPTDVMIMSKAYDAPELLNYYCTQDCPIGQLQNKAPLECEDINRISLMLISSTFFLNDINKKILRIFEDGVIGENEKKDFVELLTVLRKVSYSAESLELWAKKNGVISERWDDNLT